MLTFDVLNFDVLTFGVVRTAGEAQVLGLARAPRPATGYEPLVPRLANNRAINAAVD